MMTEEKTILRPTEDNDDDFWTDDLVEDSETELEDIDVSKVKFTKLKDLICGMQEINLIGVIDFVGPIQGKGYGEDPFAVAFIKDASGEVKITFWGDDTKIAKPGKKIRVIDCSIGEYNGQLQVYPNRQRGIEFI